MIDTIDSFNKWIYGLGMHGIRPGLESTEELMRRLGNPQKRFSSFHVAGTDGKGSTCAMLSSVLTTSGVKTGLYTSPHLVRFNERINVDGMDITDAELIRLANIVGPITDSMRDEGTVCTMFEIATAMAFLYFADRGVEYAVIETGMGGRLDATNIIVPDVSVITNISMEHTEYLGNTVEKISYEKAGIIKRGVPVITANTGTALNVIREKAKSLGSEVIEVNGYNVISSERHGISFRYKEEEYYAGIPGRHQAQNAAVVIETIKASSVFEKVKNSIHQGLRKVSWPGRMEEIDDTDIIIDVTHTLSGSERLRDDISELYGNVALVIGMLNDKDMNGVCSNLSKIASFAVVTRPPAERAANTDTLYGVMSIYHDRVFMENDVQSAVQKAISLKDADQKILVTGSLYMAGDVMKWLGKTS